MSDSKSPRNLEKAAQRGEPSYVWRAGQQRRLEMILAAAGERVRQGRTLVDGCGVGTYLEHLSGHTGVVVGLDIELERTVEAHERSALVACAAGEHLPFPPASYDLILSHEVLEHVADDRAVISEIVRCLRVGGRLVLFCPNRGYPFETHGIYWRGAYHFGNIPLVNYLPRRWRDRLAPHVNVYTSQGLKRLFAGLPVRLIERRIIFGAYDNIIARRPRLGNFLRAVLQALEHTPLQILGLSHFWVVEKI
jgi:SAM-dependent methyltransferase